jgi:hypothetical protein
MDGARTPGAPGLIAASGAPEGWPSGASAVTAAAAQEAQDVAAFMLGDAEIDENVTALIGTCLRQRLSAGG